MHFGFVYTFFLVEMYPNPLIPPPPPTQISAILKLKFMASALDTLRPIHARKKVGVVSAHSGIYRMPGALAARIDWWPSNCNFESDFHSFLPKL